MASSSVITKYDKFVVSGFVNAADFENGQREFNVKTYICMLTSFNHDQCPQDAIKAAGVTFVHIPTEVPGDMTVEHARRVQDAVAAAETPVWIQCASANRASAALLLYLAKANGWTADTALAYGREHGMKCVTVEPVRNWIISTLNPISIPAVTEAGGRLIFRQLFEPTTSTYTYILAEPDSREAVIIDPVMEKAARDITIINELGLTLKYSINTHVHADHISGSYTLKHHAPHVKSVVAHGTGAESDIFVDDGDLIKFGTRHLTVLRTPGHTNGCLSFLLDDNSMVFTGDALFVRGCGRTDFQQGDSSLLYDMIHTKLFTLPESCIVYPGHDYNGHLRSSIGEEKRYNPRLNKTKEQFVKIMAELNLPAPRLIDVAVPANMKDGKPSGDAPAPALAAATPVASGAVSAAAGSIAAK